MKQDARSLCLRALMEWERGTIFSDEILHGLLQRHPLEPLQRSLLTELFYGTLRHLRQLDFLSSCLREGKVDKKTRNLLRLGLYQIFHLRVPPHAAVNETVSLAGPARGLLNAVLRRALHEREHLVETLAAQPLPVRESHPDFLVERWRVEFGLEATEALCRINNTPAPNFFRVNKLRASVERLLEEVPEAELFDAKRGVLRLRRIPAHWLSAGWGYVQDPSTLLAPELLDPRPGMRILDACAAPGGKTLYMAQLMQGKGRIVASDVYDSRLKRLRENVATQGAISVRVQQADFLMAPEPGSLLLEAPFDGILLDVPCSNTGVIRRRVDVRWRLSGEDFIRMPVQQLGLVRRAVPLLKPGGVLVYSTCSLEREENQGVVEAVLGACPELELQETRMFLPFRDGVDGAFAARFRKASVS